jgi:iron complex outermembrane receptor protein
VQLLAQSGFSGIQDGTYFTNAMDTRSRGVDVVASHAVRLGRAQQLEMVAAYNQTRTSLTHVAPEPPQLAADGPLAVATGVEYRNPRETTTLALNYSLGRFGFNVDSRRSGPTAALVNSDGSPGGLVNPHWIPDVRASYQFNRMRVALNVANLFDAYPDEWSDFKNGAQATGASYGGTFRYPGAGTFGTDGRMLSLQVSYR